MSSQRILPGSQRSTDTHSAEAVCQVSPGGCGDIPHAYEAVSESTGSGSSASICGCTTRALRERFGLAGGRWRFVGFGERGLGRCGGDLGGTLAGALGDFGLHGEPGCFRRVDEKGQRPLDECYPPSPFMS